MAALLLSSLRTVTATDTFYSQRFGSPFSENRKYWVGMTQNTTFGYDERDLIVSDPTRYTSFKNIFVPNVRYGDNIQDQDALNYCA